MVELVVDSQIKREPDVPEDYYSHTGNSWNQSDIDEAYENYYSSVLLLPQDEPKDKESSSSGDSEIKTAKRSRRTARKKRASQVTNPPLKKQDPEPVLKGETTIDQLAHDTETAAVSSLPAQFNIPNALNQKSSFEYMKPLEKV